MAGFREQQGDLVVRHGLDQPNELVTVRANEPIVGEPADSERDLALAESHPAPINSTV
jgi:hypothetical protein